MSIASLFCRHNWRSHKRKKYKWDTIEIVKGTEGWFAPKIQTITYSETVEVLICSKCGKIKQITY